VALEARRQTRHLRSISPVPIRSRTLRARFPSALGLSRGFPSFDTPHSTQSSTTLAGGYQKHCLIPLTPVFPSFKSTHPINQLRYPLHSTFFTILCGLTEVICRPFPQRFPHFVATLLPPPASCVSRPLTCDGFLIGSSFHYPAARSRVNSLPGGRFYTPCWQGRTFRGLGDSSIKSIHLSMPIPRGFLVPALLLQNGSQWTQSPRAPPFYYCLCASLNLSSGT
jgi:hypothetical protein